MQGAFPKGLGLTMSEMDKPGSHGCMRSNADVIDLFNRVPVYTPVDIVAAE